MKKIISLFAAISLLVGINAGAFTYPTPDWGALLNEKKEMVNETEFELFAESTQETAPYYGAKFEPKKGVYIGTVPENSERLLPVSSYLTYIDDMYQDDLYWPANEMIRSDNVITMVGWTINDINNIDYDHIKKVLDTLNSYNKPMIIRFANEMNVSNLGDDPELYKKVFRKVADMIHSYPNFAVVWSPNDLGALDRPFEYFYPGDEYVDWIGASCYMIKYFLGNQDTTEVDSIYFMTGEYSWAVNRLKPLMQFLEKNNIKKPVLLGESGVATHTIHDNDLLKWTEPRLRDLFWNVIMKYPQIKMINYFNVHRDEKETFDISQFDSAVRIFGEARDSGAYLREYNTEADFVYKKANEAGALSAKDGKINLHTLAHFPHKDKLTVNYYLDGKWYHSSDSIPYTCPLSINGISDGVHTVEISAFDKKEKYTFIKSGDSINFWQKETPDEISVLVNGKSVKFDQKPIIENDRTLVPLRAIFEAIGAKVEWIAETKTVKAQKDITNVSLTIGENKMYVNGEEKTLDVPAMVKNDRTLVPVRAISEALSCKVDWDGATKSVIVEY